MLLLLRHAWTREQAACQSSRHAGPAHAVPSGQPCSLVDTHISGCAQLEGLKSALSRPVQPFGLQTRLARAGVQVHATAIGDDAPVRVGRLLRGQEAWGRRERRSIAGYERGRCCPLAFHFAASSPASATLDASTPCMPYSARTATRARTLVRGVGMGAGGCWFCCWFWGGGADVHKNALMESCLPLLFAAELPAPPAAPDVRACLEGSVGVPPPLLNCRFIQSPSQSLTRLHLTGKPCLHFLF